MSTTFVSLEAWNDPVFDFAAPDLLTLVVVLIDLAYQGKKKEIVFRFIIEYSS